MDNEYKTWNSKTDQPVKYAPRNWAGIDCIGFVLRTQQWAYTDGTLGDYSQLGITRPEDLFTNTGIFNTGVKKYQNDYKGNAYYFADVKKDKNALQKMHKGDVVFYPTKKHITTVWSDRWGKSQYGQNDSKAKYDVIHAFGYECEEDDINKCKDGLWFRKTGVTKNTHIDLHQNPSGFGRIMLWE